MARHQEGALADKAYGPGEPGTAESVRATVSALAELRDVASPDLRADLELLVETGTAFLRQQATAGPGGFGPPRLTVPAGYGAAYRAVVSAFRENCGITLPAPEVR